MFSLRLKGWRTTWRSFLERDGVGKHCPTFLLRQDAVNQLHISEAYRFTPLCK